MCSVGNGNVKAKLDRRNGVCGARQIKRRPEIVWERGASFEINAD